MPCDLWRSLLEQCYEAETAYTRALAESCGLAGEEFDAALQRAEEARDASQACEKVLVRHEQMHDCVRTSTVAKAS